MASVSSPAQATVRPTPSPIARILEVLEGLGVSDDAVRYLCEVRDMGGAIVARNTSLRAL
jgi:hypothetical protein